MNRFINACIVSSLTGALAVLAPMPHAAAAGRTILCGPDYGYGCVRGTGYQGQTTWGSDPANGHNCVSYAGYRLAMRGATKPWPGRIGNANEWDDFARAAGHVVNRIPVSGAIAQWEAGTTYAPGRYGHIGHVDAVTADYIDVSEDNYSSSGNGYTRRVRIFRGSAYWPSNFIHISDLGSTAVGARFIGDWDGNGTTTIGVVYRTSNGLQWHLRNSNSPGAASTIFNYGTAKDTPIVGNWDGHGGDTIGIARSTTTALQWHLRNYNSAGPANTVFNYGVPTDMPVVGNWDGYRGDTIGVARSTSSALEWHLRNYNSSGPAGTIFRYGVPTDMPIAGNWDAFGGDTVGVARTTSNALQWHLRNYNSAGPAGAIFNYGSGDGSDGPVVGNWDGARGDSVGVLRRTSSGMQWHLRNYNSAGPAGAIFSYGSSVHSVG